MIKDAPHAFFNDSRPLYQAEAWATLKAYLNRTVLVDPGSHRIVQVIE